MTEQEIVATPKETALTSSSEQKATQTSASPKKTAGKATKKLPQKTSSQNDEEKRLARNAALREWRKKNKDRYAAYMSEWRVKRKGKQPMPLEPTSAATPASPENKRSSAGAKKTTSKKSQKGGKA